MTCRVEFLPLYMLHGVCKVFDSPSSSQPVLRRESSGPSGSSLPEGEMREQEESPGAQERASVHWRVVLNAPILDTAHRRPVESECPYGAEPRPCPWFLGPCLHHLMFHSFHERYSYRSFIYVESHIKLKLNGYQHHL